MMKKLKVKTNEKLGIKGLDDFKKEMEKHFFSTMTIRSFSLTNNRKSLVIEMTLNFTLKEVNYFLKKEMLKNIAGNIPKSLANTFNHALTNLKEKNNCQIEIEEFSFILKNTSVIIKRICRDSIELNFKKLLAALIDEFNGYTQYSYDIPYEIYIPIFLEESIEDTLKERKNLLESKLLKRSGREYFKFWGLYYEPDDNAQIYDFQNREIISGDLNFI